MAARHQDQVLVGGLGKFRRARQSKRGLRGPGAWLALRAARYRRPVPGASRASSVAATARLADGRRDSATDAVPDRCLHPPPSATLLRAVIMPVIAPHGQRGCLRQPSANGTSGGNWNSIMEDRDTSDARQARPMKTWTDISTQLMRFILETGVFTAR